MESLTIHPSYHDVWAEWFGDSLGRGVGNPQRGFEENFRGFIKYIESNALRARSSSLRPH